MKTYRVFTYDSKYNEWIYIWTEKAESFDLDRYIMELGAFGLNDYVPTDIRTNYVYSVREFDDNDDHYFGHEIACTNCHDVWSRWMESVKEVF